MSFDKHYANRKDHRAPYRGSKAFDRSCRNHGSCAWCNPVRALWRRREDRERREVDAMIPYGSTKLPHRSGCLTKWCPCCADYNMVVRRDRMQRDWLKVEGWIEEHCEKLSMNRRKVVNEQAKSCQCSG